MEIFYILIIEKIPLIEGFRKKFEDLERIRDSFKNFENEYLIYTTFRSIHESHKGNFEGLLQEAKGKIRDQAFHVAISIFKEMKLSETPVAISERISLAFTPLVEVSDYVIIDDINSILDAYIENIKARMNSCKKAHASLKKINVMEGDQLANLDPKIFSVRLEAEAAFINKYLASLKDLKVKKIQEHKSIPYFLPD